MRTNKYEWYSRWDLNPHELLTPRILSPVRLPISPLEHIFWRYIYVTHTPLSSGRAQLFYISASDNGAWGRSRTFKHWFLRPTALPICLPTHIECRGDLIEPLNFSAIVYVNYWSGLSIAIVRIIILAVRFLLPSCTKLTPYQSGLVNVYPDLTLTNGRFCLHNL